MPESGWVSPSDRTPRSRPSVSQTRPATAGPRQPEERHDRSQDEGLGVAGVIAIAAAIAGCGGSSSDNSSSASSPAPAPPRRGPARGPAPPGADRADPPPPARPPAAAREAEADTATDRSRARRRWPSPPRWPRAHRVRSSSSSQRRLGAAATRSRHIWLAVEPIRLGVNRLLERADPILSAYASTGSGRPAPARAWTRWSGGSPATPGGSRLFAGPAPLRGAGRAYAHTYVLEDAYLSALAAALPDREFDGAARHPGSTACGDHRLADPARGGRRAGSGCGCRTTSRRPAVARSPRRPSAIEGPDEHVYDRRREWGVRSRTGQRCRQLGSIELTGHFLGSSGSRAGFLLLPGCCVVRVHPHEH